MSVRANHTITTGAALCALAGALAAEQPAAAVDLDALVEAWTQSVGGAGGNDGVDEALGVSLDAAADVVVVGYVDGAVGHGTDGYAVAYAPDASIAWELTLDAGEIGADRASSDDRYAAVAIEPLTDGVALCGSQGPDDASQAATRYLIEARLPSGVGGPPYVDWSIAYTAGASSANQSCRSASWGGGYVYATGTADHGPDLGAWVSWKFLDSNGQAVIPTQFYDYAQFAAVPDVGRGVAANIGTGDFAIAGARGFAGLDGSPLNDTDWHVKYLDPNGVELWSDTFRGAADLDDQALAVAIDPVTRDVFVAGYQNAGTDNGPNADYDWLVIRYDDLGDGLGNPLRVWTQTYESAPGASEGATSIALDSAGDLLVGGWAIDAGTGVERWRVAKMANYDGAQLQEWLGPARAGDSRVNAVAYRGPNVAIAGWIDDGAGPDFAVTFLDEDLDEDGVANAVDACPDDPEKAADTGICGCNVPDVDTDGDGTENCLETCPTDPNKTEPGVCGCEQPDDDTDGDGTFDCEDRCPTDPLKDDSVGECGCDVPDADTDGDGVLGCNDACNNTPPGSVVDAFGCPVGTESETGDTGEDAPVTDATDKGGCGCAADGQGPVSGGLAVALAVAGLIRRRRHVVVVDGARLG